MKKIYKLRIKWKVKMRRFLGLCVQCGKDSPLHSSCYSCLRKRRKPRTCKIKKCSNVTKKGTQFCDDHSSHRYYRNSCSVCFNICDHCGKLFTAKKSQNKKCKVCWTPEIINKTCAYHLCKKEFSTSNNTKTTCSDICSKKLGDYLAKQKRRAERHSNKKFIEPVHIGVLFNRDKKRCTFCGKKLKLSTHFLNRYAPTIDHIIPLSKDGEHSYRNTQLSCRGCNLKKGNRYVSGGEQLLLFGI